MSSNTSDRSSSSSPILTQDEIVAEGAIMEPSHDKMEDLEVQSGAQSTKEMTDVDNLPGTSSGSRDTSGMDKLLQKHKNEIMYELRRLQLGDRPVTGQGHKEAVENFFIRAQNGTDTDESEHRPQHVSVEVNALVERRPVSSILQSAGFRRNLETALRGALGNISSRRIPPAQRTPDRSNITNGQSSGIPAAPPLLLGDRHPAHPTPSPRSESPFRQPSTPQETLPRPPSYSNIATQSREQPYTTHEQAATPRPVVTPRTTSRQPVPELPQPPTGPALAQQWLLQQVPAQADPGVERQLNVTEILEQSQREEFISDISELVHRQLVTSSLESNFRSNLENLMRSHLDATGSDGARVQELIQSLPPRPTTRNDFSHLGINMQALSDNLDDVSVISATAAVTVPYAQSTAGLSREMAAIKAQLTQLTNMMQTSFDMQLDIQRAIRQEVAAAMNDAMTDKNASVATAAASRSQPANRPVSDNHCLICLDKFVDSVLYQCGHMCVCYGCGMDLRSRDNHCPVCRAPIRDIIRAYRSNVD